MTTAFQEMDRWETAVVPPSATAQTMLENVRNIANRPGIILRKNADQTFGPSQDVDMVWDVAQTFGETGGMWDVSDPTKLVVQREGIWLFACNVRWENVGDSRLRRSVDLDFNGQRRASSGQQAATPTLQNITVVTNVAVGSNVLTKLRHQEPSNISVLGQPTLTHLTALWLGAASGDL